MRSTYNLDPLQIEQLESLSDVLPDAGSINMSARSDIGGNKNATSANSNMDGYEIRRATKVDIGTCLSRI